MTVQEPEILDLVDQNDVVIGQIDRQDIPKLMNGEREGFVRATGCFLVNSSGEFWVPRRQPWKSIAPNGFDFSAGEHVQEGESYETANVRGLDEELNIKADAARLEYVGKLPPLVGIPYFHGLFLYHSDKTPQYNKDDFESSEWVAPDVLRQRLLDGAAAKEPLLPAVEMYLSHLRSDRS